MSEKLPADLFHRADLVEPPTTNPVLTRSQVYELIDGERAYQDTLWSELDRINSLGDFLIYIRNYLDVGFKELYGTHDNFKSRDAVRKIAGLSVAALEIHGGRPRSEEGSTRK